MNKKELETLVDYIERGDSNLAVDYLFFCLEEVNFHDDVRKMSELKKMHKEDGDLVRAQSIQEELLEKVRVRQESNKALKSILLSF